MVAHIVRRSPDHNHVIAGATTIRVVVPNTFYKYSARVVGYDTASDVAVLQLQNAVESETVAIGNASTARVGARVTAVGNAGGTRLAHIRERQCDRG